MAKNAIFSEYSKAEQRKLLKLRRKGWVDPPRPQIDADLDSEAMQRIVSLVNAAAADIKRPLNGVWARFGKPYAPLGIYTDLSKGKHGASRLARGARAAAAASAATVALSTPAAAPDTERVALPQAAQCTLSMKRQAVNAMLTNLTQNRVVTQTEAEEQQLLCRKSILQFSTLERREAMFPQVLCAQPVLRCLNRSLAAPVLTNGQRCYVFAIMIARSTDCAPNQQHLLFIRTSYAQHVLLASVTTQKCWQ